MTPVDGYHNDIWDIFVSSPAIDPDLEGGVLYFGTGSGHLYALDAATGGLRWKFKTDGVVHSSPALAYGMVYFGSWDTYLYALDARTGQVKWKFKTENTHDAMRGIQASPLVYDGKVYFGARDAHFYALDAFTGKEQWKYFADWAWISRRRRPIRARCTWALPIRTGCWLSMPAPEGKIYLRYPDLPVFVPGHCRRHGLLRQFYGDHVCPRPAIGRQKVGGVPTGGQQAEQLPGGQ
jgi:hypothetical protein